MTEIDGRVLPVEVKSGKDYKKHAALNNLLASEEYGVKDAIVLSANNLEQAGNILYCPVYMTPLIRSAEIKPVMLETDIFGMQ